MLPPDRLCGLAPLHPLPTQQTPVSLGLGRGRGRLFSGCRGIGPQPSLYGLMTWMLLEESGHLGHAREWSCLVVTEGLSWTPSLQK